MGICLIAGQPAGAGLCAVPTRCPPCCSPPQVCHNVVKKAWAQATRTYSRKQRQRRPSYCLRQSTGAAPAGAGSSREASLAALDAAATERKAAVVPLRS